MTHWNKQVNINLAGRAAGKENESPFDKIPITSDTFLTVMLSSYVLQ